MIISFSVPVMLPMIRAGLAQREGDISVGRVKRQTIRAMGPRAVRLLAMARERSNTIPYDLHLWWKSRTAERYLIGTVPASHGISVFHINIVHTEVNNPDGSNYPICRIDGPHGWRAGDSMLFWSPGNEPNGFAIEAFNDGFDSPEAFRDYFIPNVGDRFDAILFKW